MRDGGSHGALATSPINVDVDPLIVAGAMGEFIDPTLVQANPLRHTELAADEPVYRGKAERFAEHITSLR